MNKYKEIRTSLNLTINEMASACGIHRQTLVKWERGERGPDNAAQRFMQTLLWLNSKNILPQYLKHFQVKN